MCLVAYLAECWDCFLAILLGGLGPGQSAQEAVRSQQVESVSPSQIASEGHAQVSVGERFELDMAAPASSGCMRRQLTPVVVVKGSDEPGSQFHSSGMRGSLR